MRLDHTALGHLLGYRLAQASIHADGVFEGAIAAPLALKKVEFVILVLIDTNPGVTAKRLSHDLALLPPNISVILDRLESRGLLRRVPHGTDKRSFVLELTAKGKTLTTQARRIAADMESQLRARLTPAELGILMELLHKVSTPPPATSAASPPGPSDDEASRPRKRRAG